MTGDTPIRYVILDAARDYMTLAQTRRWNTPSRNLWEGPRGRSLEDVAPHLLACDDRGNLAKLVLRPKPPGEVGILLKAEVDIDSLRKHLRRFLLVQRERDARRVYFRYYDPRVLRVFLPVCTKVELAQFFGPIDAFYCQDEDIGRVLSFRLSAGGRLIKDEQALPAWLESHYPKKPKVAAASAPGQPGNVPVSSRAYTPKSY